VRNSAVTPLCGEMHKPRLVSNGELGVTFIGHSSFLVQIGGQSVMIDPNFARWLFVLKRLRRPGVRVRDLPAIDLVLVTHAHFDHLHRPSLRAIVQNNLRMRGTAPAVVIPSHVTDLVSDLGFSEIIELDWWNASRRGNLSVTHVPSRHWGARILRDSHRGYGGYVLKAGKHSVYHAGDTAYFAGFRERWMVPMHYGTFRLSHEPVEEPLQLLEKEARAAGIEDQVVVLEEGITRFF
jgi:L-ascorbate metabolism protein UlaG (beta-lactamase superfamily)